MKFKDFYEIPKFKKLDNVGKTIFVFSFVLPVVIVYTFLHLYFWPFGLERTYTLEDRNLRLTDEGFFYEEDLQEVLDGTSQIELHTRITKRNLRTTVSVEGDGLYLIPEVFTEDDVDFEPIFSRNFEEDFDYLLLDDYKTEDDTEYIVFKLDYELNTEEEIGGGILLKYQNMKAIQRGNVIEFNVEKKHEDESTIYSTWLGLKETVNTVYFVYKKPVGMNGFIEILAEGKISDRVVIPQKNFNESIGQEYVSLKNAESLVNFLEAIPEELKSAIESNQYYEKKLEGFNGKIRKLSIGYEYPVNLSKSFSTLRNTPMFFRIVGENAKIENVEINIHRGPIWEKF